MSSGHDNCSAVPYNLRPESHVKPAWRQLWQSGWGAWQHWGAVL